MAPRDWIALLPAAKTTQPGGDGPAWAEALSDDASLAGPRRTLMETLQEAARTAPKDVWEGIVEATDEVAEQTREVARDLDAAPCRRTWDRYEGPVAARFGAGSLTKAQRRGVWFVTATAGIVAADDWHPDERLAVGTRLDGLGVLATWWRPHTTARLRKILAKDAVVWDLLGSEYGRAVDVTDGRLRIDVRFEKDGRAAPSATAKQLRGLAARHLATRDGEAAADPAQALEDFDEEVAGDRWTFAEVGREEAGPRGQRVRQVRLRPA